MKRFILSFITIFLTVFGAEAQTNLEFGGVTIEYGVAIATINISTLDTDASGFQCDILAPEGAKILDNEDYYPKTAGPLAVKINKSPAWNFDYAEQKDGSLRFLVYGTKLSTFTTNYTGTSKALFTIPFDRAEGTVKVYNIMVANGKGERLQSIEEFSFSLDGTDLYLAEGYEGTCHWYITKGDGMLVIKPTNHVSGDLPANGWGVTIDDNSKELTAAPWGSYRDNILSVTILPGVNATSCANMFLGMSKIKNMDLSGLNTTNTTDMSSMFDGCYALTTLDLSNFNTTNVKNMGGMFYECSALTSIDLSSFNTANVMDMNHIFYKCSALTSLNLSNFNTEKVTDTYAMFCGNTALISLDLTNFNTANVTDMSRMFEGCSNLATIVSNNTTPSPLKVGTFSTFDYRTNCTLLVPLGTNMLYANADGWNELGNIVDDLPNKDFILGDVNGDKRLSVTDVVGVISWIVKDGLDAVSMRLVDCNKDGAVNVADVTVLADAVINKYFLKNQSSAKATAKTEAWQTPMFNLASSDSDFALSFSNSNNYCAMQFDITLTDDSGNDITSADNIRISIQGHDVAMGIVDGRLRTVVYSLTNDPFKFNDVITISTVTGSNCTVSITNAVLVSTTFQASYPDDVTAHLSVTNGISELTTATAGRKMYDLNGRKLSNTTSRGIVIINNKKVLK